MQNFPDITFSVDDAILFFKRNFWVIFLVSVLVCAAAAAFTFSLDKKYASKSQLIVELNKQSVVNTEQNAYGATDLNALRGQIEVIKSPAVLHHVAENLKIGDNKSLFSEKEFAYITDLSPEQREVYLSKRLKKMLEVSLLAGTNVIEIEATTTNAQTSADIVNEVALQYIAYLEASELSSIKDANVLISEQIDHLRNEMEKASAELEEYRLQSGLLSNSKEDLTEDQLLEISQQITSVRVQLAEKEARLQSARKTLNLKTSIGEESVFDVINAPVIASLKQQLSIVRQELSQIRTKYKPSHPAYKAVLNKERGLLSAIRAESENVVSSLSSEVRILKNKLASLERNKSAINSKLLKTKESVPQLRQFEQYAEITENIFQLYSQRLEETGLNEKLVQANASLVSLSKPNYKPVSPNNKLNILLGGVGGVLLGFIIALIKDFFDNGIVSTESLGKIIGTKSNFFILSEKKIKNFNRSPSELSEMASYPGLCDLAFYIKKELKKGHNIISQVSSIPDEGKTTSSLMLAQILGRSGLNVLLLDFDYRKRKLTKILADPAHSHFFNAQDESKYTREMLHSIQPPSSKWSFSFMPCGDKLNDNIWRMLEGDMFKNALGAVASHYDLVLIDTPPVLAVKEVKHILSLAQLAVFVVRWRKTPRKTVELASNLIKESGPLQMITVLNHVHPRKASYYGDITLDFYANKYKDY